ncbi:5-azacytidine-induced protein 2 isoform X2 [Sus scrofa]|uniref:5-azacytidine-induced protein 2 isoform X2 n=1 Tax=Sus scrofa TaxID=9823 RepID=UPI000A2B2DD6|nr:5-azacytidine-induced protein 2 isoform X2 [Sus scrofa]XP_020927141.1 5-azacytidine-induced protein 2 isoform X2 [Sus scrofa]
MEALIDDDICILDHEKAHRRDTVTPVSIYSDESVASHFALVTAYEDIKKRLKDSEKENSFLKKRIRFLEEKLLGARKDEETSSVGREQVNKAYHAYREVCIDRDNLKSKLDKINKDNSESLKVLNEQLQSKEVELLQLRTEVETQQVIRNLNPPSSNWEVEKLSCDLKIHGLEQELELMKKECRDLKIELQKAKQTDPPQEDSLKSRDLQRLSTSSDNMQNAYWELKREMSNLHLVTQVQAELLRKLKTPTAIKKGNWHPSRIHRRPREREHKTALDKSHRSVQKTAYPLTKQQSPLSGHTFPFTRRHKGFIRESHSPVMDR